MRCWGFCVKYIVGKMIGTKHKLKYIYIVILSMLIQPNLDAITREKNVKISTNIIKIPVRLIRFLLCFLLLNERFKAGVVPSGNILESLKNSSIVCIGLMAVIGDVL